MPKKRSTMERVKQLVFDAEFAYSVYGDEASLRLLRTLQQLHTIQVAEERTRRVIATHLPRKQSRKTIPVVINSAGDLDRAFRLM
jgi:hypothetical protein